MIVTKRQLDVMNCIHIGIATTPVGVAKALSIHHTWAWRLMKSLNKMRLTKPARLDGAFILTSAGEKLLNELNSNKKSKGL